jgi:hypothetical protein
LKYDRRRARGNFPCREIFYCSRAVDWNNFKIYENVKKSQSMNQLIVQKIISTLIFDDPVKKISVKNTQDIKALIIFSFVENSPLDPLSY